MVCIIYCIINVEKRYAAEERGMESSTPQEGGTTDEEYYGQPLPMLNKEIKLAAQNDKCMKMLDKNL